MSSAMRVLAEDGNATATGTGFILPWWSLVLIVLALIAGVVLRRRRG